MYGSATSDAFATFAAAFHFVIPMLSLKRAAIAVSPVSDARVQHDKGQHDTTTPQRLAGREEEDRRTRQSCQNARDKNNGVGQQAILGSENLTAFLVRNGPHRPQHHALLLFVPRGFPSLASAISRCCR